MAVARVRGGIEKSSHVKTNCIHRNLADSFTVLTQPTKIGLFFLSLRATPANLGLKGIYSRYLTLADFPQCVGRLQGWCGTLPV